MGPYMKLVFPPERLEVITRAVAAAEQRTSGEIRVVIRANFEHGVHDVAEQARREFARHNLAATRDRTGVLVLLVFEARQFYVMGDIGIHSKLPDHTWEGYAVGLRSFFATGMYVEGFCWFIREIGSQLAQHFPRRDDDHDELPNHPHVEH